MAGKVVGYLAVERGGNVTRFRLRVDEVLRGQAPSSIEFQVPIDAPIPSCDLAPLSVEMGDQLALALDGSEAINPPVVAVARIVGGATPADGSGPEELTLVEVRAIAAKPGSPWPLLALGGAILAAFLVRPGWRRPTRDGLVTARG